MRDISARELKGHNILAVERFWDNTRWMIEFSVLRPSTPYGSPGDEMRLFLTEDGYQAALQSQQRREIKIKRYARVIEGHISRDNKAWAKTIPMPEDSATSQQCADLVVDRVNPGLVDLFTRQARKSVQEKEKGSVLQKLKQELPAHKPAAPKKREPER